MGVTVSWAESMPTTCALAEQSQGRRRWDREDAVGGVGLADPETDRAGPHFIDVECVQRRGDADGVHDGVHAAQLVQVHHFEGNAVGVGLDRGQRADSRGGEFGCFHRDSPAGHRQ